MGAAGFRAAALALACTACTSIAVDHRSLEGTSWRVAAINGEATPAAGDYRIEFGNGRISGRFGCNGWGGNYTMRGNAVIADRVISTMMACSDPAARFESEGLAILRQPMRWSWRDVHTMTLSNGAGSIELQLQVAPG
jgi:heat shock protein HslJ